MRPRICASIAAKNISQLIQVIRDADSMKPDLIEIRFDHLESVKSLEKVRKATSLPLIATNRRRDQGGLYDGPEPPRIRTLLDACGVGFDYVDLEMTTASVWLVAEDVKKNGAKLIASRHDLLETPTRNAMDHLLENELDLEPDICKIVGRANSIVDNLAYLNFIVDNPDIELVAFGMGEMGVLSRVLSPLFGGAFTYASVDDDKKSAPGQKTIVELREIYRQMGAQ